MNTSLKLYCNQCGFVLEDNLPAPDDLLKPPPEVKCHNKISNRRLGRILAREICSIPLKKAEQSKLQKTTRISYWIRKQTNY